MAGLVDDDMANELLERHARLPHFQQQRLAKQAYDRWRYAILPHKSFGQGSAFIQAGQVPAIRDAYRFELVRPGEFFDLEHHIAELFAEFCRQSIDNGTRGAFEF